MAQTYAKEVSALNETPVGKTNAKDQGARVLQFRGTIEYDAQASGDTVVLAKVPKGYRFAYGTLNTSVTTATATLAIGTAASAGKYRAAATRTTADAPEVFGVVAATAELAADETIIATVGTAALPASGSCVVDLFFTKAG